MQGLNSPTRSSLKVVSKTTEFADSSSIFDWVKWKAVKLEFEVSLRDISIKRGSMNKLKEAIERDPMSFTRVGWCVALLESQKVPSSFLKPIGKKVS